MNPPNHDIYVASSWRNNEQPAVVQALRAEGHNVYDFKNPRPGNHGFHWSSIDSEWQKWTPEQFRAALDHQIAREGFHSDWSAMEHAEVCVLVMPCGRSAHIEAGYFVGAGKLLIILLAEKPSEPELMYRMADYVVTSLDDVVDILRDDQVIVTRWTHPSLDEYLVLPGQPAVTRQEAEGHFSEEPELLTYTIETMWKAKIARLPEFQS